MKSDRRHDLEANWLARHITKWIDSGMPYGQTIVWCLIGLLAAYAAWSWYGKSVALQQGAAWFDYNLAVEGNRPNLDLLQKAAEDHPGTPVAEVSDITWADGQLWQASLTYLSSKPIANDYLDSAIEKYEAVLGKSRDPLLTSRAHWGLGRAYEMKAEVEKAKAEYEKVDGPFKPLAEGRLKALENSRVQESLTWLASAEVPRRPVPSSGGTPGVRPPFQVDEFGMPSEGAGTESTVDDIIRRLQVLGSETPDRYAPPGDQPPPGVTDEAPATGPELPTTDTPPAEEAPAAETPAEDNPAEENPASGAEQPQP